MAHNGHISGHGKEIGREKTVTYPRTRKKREWNHHVREKEENILSNVKGQHHEKGENTMIAFR